MTASHPHHLWIPGYTVEDELGFREAQVCPDCNAWRHKLNDGHWSDGAGNKSAIIHNL